MTEKRDRTWRTQAKQRVAKAHDKLRYTSGILDLSDYARRTFGITTGDSSTIRLGSVSESATEVSYPAPPRSRGFESGQEGRTVRTKDIFVAIGDPFYHLDYETHEHDLRHGLELEAPLNINPRSTSNGLTPWHRPRFQHRLKDMELGLPLDKHW